MPYKDPKMAKANKKEYYERRKKELKAFGIEYYKKNKKTILDQHAAKSDILKEECRKWRKSNPEKIKVYKKTPVGLFHVKKSRRTASKKEVELLKDRYVIHKIKAQVGLSVEQIKANPELIENHRQIIKVKRLIKQKKNGK